MRANLRPIVALLFLAACMVGTTGRSYAPARGPAGAMVQLELGGKREVGGELLAVEEATLLILQEQQLTRVPLVLIESGKAPRITFVGGTMSADTRERLRLVSRYPQGISPELEARLLQAYGASGVRQIS